MFIHVRLRDGADDDLKAWYESQGDKSGMVREALRAYIRLQNGESQAAIIREAVAQATGQLPTIVVEAIGEAVTQATGQLPTIVAEAVREALAAYQLSPAQETVATGEEDPELAARLDAQLADFD